MDAYRLIDLLCDEFETAVARGEVPTWSLDSPELNSEQRKLLFIELLRIDLRVRRERGEHPVKSEYEIRFPEFTSAISAIFTETDSPSRVTVIDRKATFETEFPANQLAAEEKLISTRFHSLRTHAVGGLGEIIVAQDQSLNREVALKQLRYYVENDPVAQVRFQQEAYITARLEHPGVVPIYGMGLDADGRCFYAMKLINGQTLHDAIQNLHQLPGVWRDASWVIDLRKLLARFQSICETVYFAHSRNIVHRDLKPLNVLLGEFGETIVLDWGLAKFIGGPDDVSSDPDPSATSAELTAAGMLLGTPAFISPERASGEDASPETLSDIYGLGAILVMILTGHPPVAGRDADEVLGKVRSGNLQYPRQLSSRVPRALDAICRRALHKNPRQRYPDARQFAEDVELWLAGEAVHACRESWQEQTHRWIKRHRQLAAAMVLMVVLFGLFGVVAVRWTEQEKRRTQLAGLAKSIASADLASLPGLFHELETFGDGRIHALETQLSESDRPSRNIRIALSMHGQNHADQLTKDFLQASLSEFLDFRARLQPFASKMTARLWQEWNDTALSPEARLKIAGALALYDPENPAWPAAGEQVAMILCQESSAWYGLWHTAFQPITRHLQPELRRIFDDNTNLRLSRSAAQFLGLSAEKDPHLLVDLLQRATPDQIAPLVRGLAQQPQVSSSQLTIALNDLTPIPQPPVPLPNERLPFVMRDRRRAKAACGLLALNRPGEVWNSLIPSADPTFRSLLIESTPHAGIRSKDLWNWWKDELDPTRRRILLLILGTLPQSSLLEQERLAWISEVERVERQDSDPAIHAASQWLLRTWNHKRRPIPEQTASCFGSRRWYETSTGETYVIVQGPIEFLMGSAQDEYFRNPADELHLRRINYSWAIASREVTHEQAVALLPYLAETASKAIGDGERPETQMTWFDAARYCRRLSEQEGIAEDQMCFPPAEQIGPQMQLPSDYFQRSGYRIPSQAEWEYACRAGTVTTAYFGDDPELYSAYTWNATNSQTRFAPTATKKPNDLGLFDTLGNVFEWCYDRCEGLPYSQQVGWARTVTGIKLQSRIAPRRTYLIRGGDARQNPDAIRSSTRNRAPAEQSRQLCGLRPVRTLPPDYRPFDIVLLPDNPANEVRYRICGHGEKFIIDPLDSDCIISPLEGVAPAVISIRNPNKDSRRFSFNLVELATGSRRTVHGQILNVEWHIHSRLVTTESESGRANAPDSIAESSATEADLQMQESTDVTKQINEVYYDQSIPADAKVHSDLPAQCEIIAVTQPKLPPGEYYLQIFGSERAFFYRNQKLYWTRSEGLPPPASKIDATLRISIRDSDEIWKVRVFSSNRDASLWLNIRPAPTLP